MLLTWAMITHYLMVFLRTHQFQGHLRYQRLPRSLLQPKQLLQHNLNQCQLLSQQLNQQPNQPQLQLHLPSQLHSLLLRHNQQLLQHLNHKLLLHNQLQLLNHSQLQLQQLLHNQHQGHLVNHPHKPQNLLLKHSQEPNLVPSHSQLVNPNHQTNQNPQDGQLVYLRQTQRYSHSTKREETRETQPSTGSLLSTWKNSISPLQCSGP